MSAVDPSTSSTSMTETTLQLTTVVLPSPSLDVPRSQPYTATAPASAQTSYTEVDMLAQENVPLPPAEETNAEQASSTFQAKPPDDPEPPQTQPQPQTEPEPVPHTPQASLTFLLVSGRRRTMSFEPDTTVGRVKELVWNAWPSEWQDERPPAPSYLRILYLGKILQDDDSLEKLSFPSHIPSPSAPAPTIVHLSIRPCALNADHGAIKKKGRRRQNRSSDGGLDGVPASNGEDQDSETGCCSGCVIC